MFMSATTSRSDTDLPISTQIMFLWLISSHHWPKRKFSIYRLCDWGESWQNIVRLIFGELGRRLIPGTITRVAGVQFCMGVSLLGGRTLIQLLWTSFLPLIPDSLLLMPLSVPLKSCVGLGRTNIKIIITNNNCTTSISSGSNYYLLFAPSESAKDHIRDSSMLALSWKVCRCHPKFSIFHFQVPLCQYPTTTSLHLPPYPHSL